MSEEPTSIRPTKRRNVILWVAVVFVVVFCVAFGVKVLFWHEKPKKGGSRIRSDMRTLATALETYFIDHGTYPRMRPFLEIAPDRKLLLDTNGHHLSYIDPGDPAVGTAGLTTPFAYITSIFPDPLGPWRGIPFAYYTDGKGWILISPGYDNYYNIQDPSVVYDSSIPQPSDLLLSRYTYDPTNGAVSPGDIWRVYQHFGGPPFAARMATPHVKSTQGGQ